MKKISLTPILQKRYKALEKSEANLRRDLKTVYAANSSRLSVIAAMLYRDCTAGDKIRYANMFKRISKREAAALKQKTQRSADVYGDYCKSDFPFTVTKFDRLNRLDAAKAELILNELESAKEAYDLIMFHIWSHAIYTMEEAAALVTVRVNTDMEYLETATEIVDNKEYPILRSLYEQHRTTGEREAELLKESLTRGARPEKAVQLLTEYAERRSKTNTDRLMYTEDTRATVEAVAEVVQDYIPYFVTVTVGDSKVCDRCELIAAAQAADPVPFSAFEPGVTAPPFHPWCRCGIEGVYLTDEQRRRI